MFSKLTRWEFCPVILPRSAGLKVARASLRSSLPTNGRNLRTRSFNTRDANGGTPGIADRPALNPHLVAQWDRVGTEGRRGNKEKALLQPLGNVEGSSRCHVPPRVPKAPSTPTAGDQSCFWRRATSRARLRIWLVIYGAQWKLQSDPRVYRARR